MHGRAAARGTELRGHWMCSAPTLARAGRVVRRESDRTSRREGTGDRPEACGQRRDPRYGGNTRPLREARCTPFARPVRRERTRDGIQDAPKTRRWKRTSNVQPVAPGQRQELETRGTNERSVPLPMTLQNKDGPKRKPLRGLRRQQEEDPCNLSPWSLNRSTESTSSLSRLGLRQPAAAELLRRNVGEIGLEVEHRRAVQHVDATNVECPAVAP